MNLTLKKYQSQAVNDLLDKFNYLMSKSSLANRIVVFKSPTGSGKTVVLASLIQELTTNPQTQNNNYCFVWVCMGKGDLHLQSKQRLDEVLGGYPLIYLLDGYTGESLPANGVVVVNFEKLYSKCSTLLRCHKESLSKK